MTVREIVEKYLGEYKEVSAGNLQVKKCPYCGREKGKFYIKEDTGVFLCHSGSCGAKGTLHQLVEHLEQKLGVKISEPKINHKNRKIAPAKLTFDKNNIGTLINSSGTENPDAKITIEYINSRGISVKTAKELMTFFQKSDKAVIFAYENFDGELVGLKYRNIKEKKIFQAAGSQAFLWNLNKATNDKIIICEGEWDCMTLAEIGLIDRCLSVPMGTGNLDWIDNCKEYLESKKEIILAFDNDDAGEKALRKVSQRLQHLNLRKIDLGVHKDINDFFLFEGAEALKKVLDNSVEIEIQGVETLYDTGRFDINDMERFLFGIPAFDRITRGAKEGELIVLAGDNGSGKTTISKQIMLNARKMGKKTLVINGEIRNEVFKEDLFLQANGNAKLQKVEDRLIPGEFDYKVTEENYHLINEWLNGYLYTMSDEENLTDKNVLAKIETAIIKNNVFFIVVDNLSVIQCEGEDQAVAKGDFVVALKRLSRKYGVCTMLVNHFTKGTKDTRERGKESIKGGGIISDIADLVVVIERIDDDSKEENGKLRTLKNRLKGRLGDVKLYYSGMYKTLNDQPGTITNYGWKDYLEVRQEIQEIEDLKQPLPF